MEVDGLNLSRLPSATPKLYCMSMPWAAKHMMNAAHSWQTTDRNILQNEEMRQTVSESCIIRFSRLTEA